MSAHPRAKRRQWRVERSVVGAVATAIAVAAGAFACATRTTATSTSSAEAGSTAPMVAVVAPIGPSRVVHGVGVGWRHDQVGAEAAAVAYVEASRLVGTSGPLARRDVVMTLATREYGPTLVEATNRQLDDLRFQLGERGASTTLVWGEHALTVDSTSRSTDEIEVRVWSVLVVGAESGSVARQVWRTSTLAVRWVDEDWKVDRWSTRPGPLPAPPPEASASSVGEVTGVLGWRPAWSAGAS